MKPAACRWAPIAGWSSASCCTRWVRRRCISKARRAATAPLSRDARPACRAERPRPAHRQLRAQCATARQDLAIAEGQLRDYEARLGKPFAHDAYLAELTGLRDQLKAGLSGTTPEPGAEPLPPAHETAERIKALKAAHSIEPAPQRHTARSLATAEEPVTARIRQRMGTLPVRRRRPSPPSASPYRCLPANRQDG